MVCGLMRKPGKVLPGVSFEAVRMVLESFQEKLKNERVRWFTDNQNVVRVVQYGSKSRTYRQKPLLFSQHVYNSILGLSPRDQNEQADYISRLVDYDDWMLNPEIFHMLDAMWGPHTIDRFANIFNNQLIRFNSRFWDPTTEAVDAFTCNWAGENNWWCPPLYLVPRVLWHAQNTKAQGTLIIPQWFSSPFWPLLFPTGTEPAEFVIQTIELPKSEDIFLPGRSGCNLFRGVPNTPVLASRGLVRMTLLVNLSVWSHPRRLVGMTLLGNLGVWSQPRRLGNFDIGSRTSVRIVPEGKQAFAWIC